MHRGGESCLAIKTDIGATFNKSDINVSSYSIQVIYTIYRYNSDMGIHFLRLIIS